MFHKRPSVEEIGILLEQNGHGRHQMRRRLSPGLALAVLALLCIGASFAAVSVCRCARLQGTSLSEARQLMLHGQDQASRLFGIEAARRNCRDAMRELREIVESDPDPVVQANAAAAFEHLKDSLR